MHKLYSRNEFSFADGTYQNNVFIRYDGDYPEPLLDLMGACKARHESLNRRFSVCAMFSCVRGFQHDMETHGLYFHAMANLLQLEIENESPLFDITKQLEKWELYFASYVHNLQQGYN